ncbi:P-loop containing nucleoside triphosphate hydrolase protein [Viridothelium virens]|uniref:DNA 3'-5' helicase n=1 Tax=Viridothelium virens TaxID=1048519 RepID=A0A6A6HAY7_VIRVR|nr:P-loop containing nucleoside triphosphate hydrolase protein [Viridothelium virens]
MTSIFENLNANQRDAVTSPASVLQVLAPPGSGKTKTLTSRVAYHIDHDGIDPSNILVCTFTIKAAREMKDRISGFIGQGRERQLILGTFHSIARRYLVTYGQYIGIPKHFGVADTSDSLAMIKRIVKNEKLGIEPAKARSRISRLKARCISPDDYNTSSSRAEEHEFALVYGGYEASLRASNLLDYDDLLLRCKDLLYQHPQCVSNLAAVLIDEFQDTNLVQFDLMRLFAQRRNKITIVGDPDQSIYGFRSAELGNLKKMQEEYGDYHLINLEENYRSSQAILETAQQIIEQDESRHSKKLRATHCRGERPTFRKIPSAAAEARWIITEIKRCRNLTVKLLGYSDFAILLRSAFLSRHIESELGKEGIPYRMVGGVKFFDRKEVKHVLDYLRVVHQPDHNDAIVRIINIPLRKISEATVEALLQEAKEDRLSLWDVVRKAARGERRPRTKLSSATQKGLETFTSVILTLQARQRASTNKNQSEDYSLKDLIECLLKKLAWKEYLRKAHPEEELETRWANVQELIAQASEISAAISQGEGFMEETLPPAEGADQRGLLPSEDALAIFLGNVALSTEAERQDDGTTELVTVSTIHAAKGLEWPIVFIPAAYDGSIPHSRAEDTDEERRLLYVGMTRAQALLFISCPMKSSQRDQTELSPFIDDPSTAGYFSPQGPTYDSLAIRSLAKILHRSPPSEEAIEEARASADLVEDDLWPLDGEEPTPETSNWDAFLGQDIDTLLPITKRRKIENITTNGLSAASGIIPASTILQSQSVHSMDPVSCQAGFMSASTRFQQIQEERQVGRIDKASPLPTARENQQAPKHREEKSGRKQLAGQGNITSFFSNGKDTSGESTNRFPLSTIQKKGPPKETNRVFREVHTNVPAFQSMTIPLELASRKPSSAPLRRRPGQISVDQTVYSSKKDYVFLSSSPTKSDENPLPQIGNHSPPLSPVRAVMEDDLPRFKSATTLHTTTVAQLGVQPKPVRRTLGTRRSLHSGWPPPKRGS